MNQDRLYDSLSDAAEILNIKEKDLLHYGVLGAIAIMVAVPEQLKVIQHQKKLVPGHVRVTYDGIPTPLFLVLKPSYCEKVETTNETFQSEFPYGYYLPELNEGDRSVGCGLLRTYPGTETDSVENPVHVWATVGKPRGSHCWENHIFESNGASPDIGSPVCINIANLLIPKCALNQIREKLKKDKEENGCNSTDVVKPEVSNVGCAQKLLDSENIVQASTIPSGAGYKQEKGLTIKALASAFSEVDWSEEKWGKYLDTRLKWVQEARLSEGQQGGVAATFNPVLIALQLRSKSKIMNGQLNKAFRDSQSLQPWADQWHDSQSPFKNHSK